LNNVESGIKQLKPKVIIINNILFLFLDEHNDL
jgi:hypothetical protein